MSRLREGPVVLLAWAGLVAVPAIVTFLFDAGLTTRLLFLDLVAGTLLIAAVDALTRPAPRRGPPPAQAVPNSSIPAVLLAIGVVELVLGAELGEWLLLIGAGTVVLGAAGVARELRAQRSALRAATGAEAER